MKAWTGAQNRVTYQPLALSNYERKLIKIYGGKTKQ
jgi:hypothetical protein